MGYLPDLKRKRRTGQAFVCMGLFLSFSGTCCPVWRVLSYISSQLGLCPGPQAGLPSGDWLPDTAVPINDQWKEPALPHSLIPLHWRRGHLGGEHHHHHHHHHHHYTVCATQRRYTNAFILEESVCSSCLMELECDDK